MFESWSMIGPKALLIFDVFLTPTKARQGRATCFVTPDGLD